MYRYGTIVQEFSRLRFETDSDMSYTSATQDMSCRYEFSVDVPGVLAIVNYYLLLYYGFYKVCFFVYYVYLFKNNSPVCKNPGN